MVYESDFYTTRRPYSRPLVSSYSVTTRPITIPLSSIIQLRAYPYMPYVAHKRLVTIVHTPVHTVYHSGSLVPIRIHSRVRPSVLAAEISRIRNLPRPTVPSYLEKYLNSRDHIYFDDEAREIRAKVDSLLRRVHVFVPRAAASDFLEEIVPERMRSGDYVRRLISGKNNAKKDVEPISWYEVPERGNFNNLACVKYVAGKPQSVRKPYYKVADLRPSDIKNDVKFLSYYSKNREAAATASPNQPMTERELRKARALEPDWTEAQRKAPKVEKEQPAKTESKPEKKRSTKRDAEPAPKPEPEKIVELEAVKVSEPEPEQPVTEQPEPTPVEQPEPAPVEKPEPAEKPEPKPTEKSERKAKRAESKAAKKVVPPPEPAKEPEPVPEPAKEPEPVPEVAKEAEPVVEVAKEPEPVPEPAKEPEPVPEPAKEPEPIPEPAKEPEAIPEAKEEKVPEPEPMVEQKEPEPVEVESAPIVESVPEASAEAVSETEKKEEENETGDKVKADKEEALKRIETYLVKAAEESKTIEERKQAAEDERVKLELEEQKAWEALQVAQERVAHIDEIREQEQAEAVRQQQEAKAEAEHLETERVLEAERELAEQHVKALMQEQQRMIIEEHMEEVREQEEKEARLANVAFNDVDEVKDVDRSCEDPITCDLTDQEREEKPYELINDDDTRIEEENAGEEEHFELSEDPFAEEPEGADSKPQTGANAVEDSPKVEEITSGGEESFEWGDEDA